MLLVCVLYHYFRWLMEDSLKLVLLRAFQKKAVLSEEMAAPWVLLLNTFQCEVSDTGESDPMWAEVNMCDFSKAFNEASLRIESK